MLPLRKAPFWGTRMTGWCSLTNKRARALALLAASVLAGVAAARAQQRQRQQIPQVVGPSEVVRTGTIKVRVRAANAEPILGDPTVVLTTSQLDGPVTGISNRMSDDEWIFRNLRVGETYVIRVEAKGFRPEQKFAHLPPYDQSIIRVDFLLQPAGAGGTKPPSGNFLLTPAAQKEVQRAIHDLKRNKVKSASTHLEKAIKLAPGNPGVNYLMGLARLRANRPADATAYFEKAVSIDPGQVSALLALGTIHYRQGDYKEAAQVLTKAVKMAPNYWRAQWMLASAYLRERDYRQALLHGEIALKHGKKNATRVNLILGEARERLGENAKARKAFEEFLKHNSHDSEAEAVRREVKRLKQMPAITPVRVEASASPSATEPANSARPANGSDAASPSRNSSPVADASLSSGPAASAAGTSKVAASASVAPPSKRAPAPPAAVAPPDPPVALPPPPNWAPPNVDADHPAIVSDAVCPLRTILKKTGRDAVALVKDLQEFSAVENYQSVEISRREKVGNPIERKFRYMVFIQHVRPGLFTIDELRQPSLSQSHMDGHWVGMGSAALALVFHPLFREDFDWECDGLGKWKGRPAWVIRFSQDPNRRISPLHAVTIGTNEYLIALKGLAWVSPKSGQVLHLETDIMKPLRKLQLTREHFSIDYHLVRFRKHRVSLWLPEDVNLYIAYRHRYYHSYSHFTDFQLFWVSTAQKIFSPKQSKNNP